MASDTGVLEDAADTLDLVHQVSSNIRDVCPNCLNCKGEGALKSKMLFMQTKSISMLQLLGEISTRMAALTDGINMCNAVLDDLKALNVLMDKALPDALKSQPEPGEPLPKMSP